MKFTSSDEGFAQKGWSRASLEPVLTDLSNKMMLMVLQLTGVLVVVTQNPSEQLTTSLVVQDLICSQVDMPQTPVM